MKRLVLNLIFIALVSCSENNENINSLQLKLNGTWENTGYFDDVVNPDNPDLEGYYPIPNGVTITYSSTTFSSTYFNEPYEEGTFKVSKDSVLRHNSSVVGKIKVLTESELIIINLSQLGGVRYIKN